MTHVILVAHGQPSDPASLARELELLAAKVALHLPEHEVRAATLAEEGALASALQGARQGLVFPLFMASGWFTQSAIPARLQLLGGEGWQVLTPFGEREEVQALAAKIACENGAGGVLLAAHGSFKSDAPAAVARKVAALIARDRPDQRVEPAYIDQSPRLAEAYGFQEDAICLPYFAMSGGHVLQDLPSALAEAGFKGKLLPALGEDERVPALIAQLIQADLSSLSDVFK